MTDINRFRELDRLFQAVCDLPNHEREARLIELTPNDASLRSEVLELLETESRTGTADKLSSEAVRTELANVFMSNEGGAKKQNDERTPSTNDDTDQEQDRR